MAQRYLVRGEMSGWFYAGRVLGPLTLLFGVFMLLLEPWIGGFIFVLGLVLTVLFEASAFAIRSKRCWLEIGDGGFVVTDRRGTRQVRDDEVQAIAYSSAVNYSNGEPGGFTRKCTLWVHQDPQPIVMENKFKKEQADPLGVFIDRLLDLLHDGFDAALTAGHAISGDDWRLSQNELFFRRNGREESLRLEEVTAVEARDGKMGVWRKGQDEPYTGFPVNGRNVWLLRRLVQSRLKDDEQSDQPPTNGLGRILFQRRSSRATVLVLAALAPIVPLIGIALAWNATDTTMFIAGIIAIVAGPLLAFASYSCAVSNFRCHEWGVYQKALSGEKRLMYADVASFSYGATRHYHNGAYTGTNISLKFEPPPGTKGGGINYAAQVKNEDADLEQLRDFVGRVMSARMGGELAQGQAVPWTKNMIFRPEGIEYTPAGFFGKKQTQFLRHENYGGWNMDQGVFYLFERGQPKAVMSENVAEANFYPGYYLLLALYPSEEANEAVLG